MKHEAQYTYELHCNALPRHWRDRVGEWLREWADRVDGRRSLAVNMDSDPPVPISVHADVMRKGVEHMARLHKDAVAAECAERLLKQVAPHLFDT